MARVHQYFLPRCSRLFLSYYYTSSYHNTNVAILCQHTTAHRCKEEAEDGRNNEVEDSNNSRQIQPYGLSGYLHMFLFLYFKRSCALCGCSVCACYRSFTLLLDYSVASLRSCAMPILYSCCAPYVHAAYCACSACICACGSDIGGQ